MPYIENATARSQVWPDHPIPSECGICYSELQGYNHYQTVTKILTIYFLQSLIIQAHPGGSRMAELAAASAKLQWKEGLEEIKVSNWI